MSATTSIGWTDATWNPMVGCSRVSAGCEHCYAERQAHRFHAIEGHALAGLTESGKHGPRWNGVVRLNPKVLELPLRWRKPRRIFVNSMGDLFHELLPDDQIAAVLGIAMLADWHTYQILTKRPERMRELACFLEPADCIAAAYIEHPELARRWPLTVARAIRPCASGWPPRHVWFGVSVENQETADERIPVLRDTPAAKRFVSYEPAIGPVIFKHHATTNAIRQIQKRFGHTDADTPEHLRPRGPGLDWIIVGGESGPGSRPFDIAWARSVVFECKALEIPCFVKQLGSQPRKWCVARLHGEPGDEYEPGHCDLWEASEAGSCAGRCHFQLSRAGTDPSEWPLDLRVQEFPR